MTNKWNLKKKIAPTLSSALFYLIIIMIRKGNLHVRLFTIKGNSQERKRKGKRKSCILFFLPNLFGSKGEWFIYDFIFDRLFIELYGLMLIIYLYIF